MVTELMLSDVFTNLVDQVVEAAHGGTLLGEDLYGSILEHAPTSWCESEPATVALAVRKLGVFCDWRTFGQATKRLDGGVHPDDLHMEMKRIEGERESLFRGPEFEETVRSIVKKLGEMQEDLRHFRKMMRDAETLMGFDEEATNKVVELLGPWDDTAVPKGFLDLLPEELAFPLRRAERSTSYDHRIHLLVRELVSRIGEEGRCSEDVIKNCGHVIGELLHEDDEEAVARLTQDQAILLADDYVRRRP